MTLTKEEFTYHADAHGPASRERFEALRNQPRRKGARQENKHGKVTVTEHDDGWVIEGEPTRRLYARTGIVSVEVLRCRCGVSNPKKPGRVKRSEWAAKGLCDELGHVDRVIELGQKILKSY